MIFTLLLHCTVLIVLYMTAIWMIANIKQDNSIADVAWGCGFMLIALYTLFYLGLFLPRQLLVTALVLMWGIRISGHILLRNWGKSEDVRYKKWRNEWGNTMLWRSFLQIFMLQGSFLLIVAYPIIVVNGTVGGPLNFLDVAGILVWLTGFLFETIGDYQLLQFTKDPSNRGSIMTEGLWRYTRHPNYFGEATLWWGIFLIALSVPHGWTTIISPVFITLMLLFVSGVPMAESIFEGNSSYEAYKKRTSAFFPWWPRE